MSVYDPERNWRFLFRTAGQDIKGFTSECRRSDIPQYVLDAALAVWHTYGDTDILRGDGLLQGDNTTIGEIEFFLAERDAALAALAGT